MWHTLCEDYLKPDGTQSGLKWATPKTTRTILSNSNTWANTRTASEVEGVMPLIREMLPNAETTRDILTRSQKESCLWLKKCCLMQKQPEIFGLGATFMYACFGLHAVCPSRVSVQQLTSASFPSINLENVTLENKTTSYKGIGTTPKDHIIDSDVPHWAMRINHNFNSNQMQRGYVCVSVFVFDLGLA